MRSPQFRKSITKPLSLAQSIPSFWLFSVPLAIALTSLALIKPAPAQEARLRTLSVQGQGTEMIQTTLAQVSLGVEVQAETAEEAQEEAARRSSAVVDLLQSANVENLETTGITLRPRYDYSGNTQRLIGYTATNLVSFRVETERAGTLIDDAVTAGATRIDGIHFTAEDEAIAAAQHVALREATENAREQANAVLDALGFTAQDIVMIEINNAGFPPVPMMDARAASFAEDASTPVVGGEQEVNASVTLHISY